MTMRTKQTVRSYGVGCLCAAAALLLAGCVISPETDEQASMVKIISDRPVHKTASADDVREAKTNGATVLTLPNDKLSRRGT